MPFYYTPGRTPCKSFEYGVCDHRLEAMSAVGRVHGIEAALCDRLDINNGFAHPVASSSPSKAEASAPSEFTKIGAGDCGVVYTREESPVVLKLAKSPESDKLWNDFVKHHLIAEKLGDWNIDIKVPQYYSFIPKDAAF